MDSLVSPKIVLPVKVRGIVLLLFFFSVYFLLNTHYSSDNLKIKFTISSSSEEVIQLFWPVKGNGETTLKDKTLQLRAGTHNYYVLISEPQKPTWLRFDPATRASTIAVEEIVLGWGPEREISCSGAQLYNALETVQQTRKELDKNNKSVLIVSENTDPILRINLSTLARPLQNHLLGKSLIFSLLATFIALLTLQYLNSEKYSSYSHRTYPSNYLQWILWGLVSFGIGGFLVFVIPVGLSEQYFFLHLLSTAFCIGCILFFPLFWFSTRSYRENIYFVSQSRFVWLWFALPSFIVWSFYLCSFWPASMSPDSLDQWRQVLKGSFKDWHPAFHTLNIWLITRLTFTPAIVGGAQIVALGSAVGWTLSVLQRYGVSRSVLWCTSFLVAIWPVNGLIVVTLWKDVAYSVVLLILAIYLFQIVMTNGGWLGIRKNWLLLGIILTLVSLYRHNGVVPALLTILALFLFYTRFWKSISVVAILAIALHAGIRGPLYDLLEVKRGNPISMVIQSFQKDFLKQGQAEIKTDTQVTQQQDNDQTQVANNKDIKDSEHKTKANKISERMYSSSRLWRVQPMNFFHKRIEYVNLWSKDNDGVSEVKYISGNTVEIHENSLIPVGRDLIYTLFSVTTHNKYFFWMWRPAVYLYLLSTLLVILSWRYRERLYLILLPALFNSLPIFLIVVHKSIFRYHYPIVILGIVLILPLLFFKPLEQNCRLNSKIK